MLESIFTKLLIMSVQAGFLILATIIIRGIFKKIPRKYICLLWCMAALRLLLPVSIESDYSLVPTENAIQNVFSEEKESDITSAIEAQAVQIIPSQEAVESAVAEPSQSIAEVHTDVNNNISVSETDKNPTVVFQPAPEKESFNPRMLVITLWIFGTVLLLGYGVFTYIKVRVRVRDAVHQEGNLWLSDRIDTPFLLGYLKPRVYIPFYVDESRREYIIAHENGHIQRGDHITKLIGYILLSVYWFQPLLWVAYVLFCKDVEMACDEKVIGGLGEEKKKAYSQTLLLCSAEKHYLLANPLAFGEIDVKKRITNVLSYKKPGVILSMVSVLVLLVVAVFFMTNGKDGQLSGTELTEAQEKYLATLADGTRYAIIPMKNSQEPLLLTTNDDWENQVFENETDRISMYSYIFETKGTIATTGIPCELRWDENGLYQATEIGIGLLYVEEGVSPVTGKPMLVCTNYGKEEEGYEELYQQFEKAAPVEFTYVVDNISGENQVLSDAQLLFMQNLDEDVQLAALPLEGAGEPLLLAAKGVYKDPAFDNAEVSFIATYCIFGLEGTMNTGGTAYPIRADYEAVYLESGHNVTVLFPSKENGKWELKSVVYAEDDEDYPQMLEKCQQASVVDFEIRMVELESAITEQQNQLVEQLNQIEGMEAETLKERRAMEELAKELRAQLEALGAVFGDVKASQNAQTLFEEKYGAPVQLGDCTSAEMAEQIAIKMFTEYMKMDNLYSSSLPSEYGHTEDNYWQVDMEVLSSAEDVYKHIRTLSTKEQAEGSYNALFGGDYPPLKEEKGKLYTTAFDGFPIQYELYTDVTIHGYYDDEIHYTIQPENDNTEGEMTSFFVRCVKEDYNWVVAECYPLMTQGSHELLPDTVHSVVDMGEYQVVLWDYGTLPGGPLEVAVLKDGKKETLSVLYEQWQRDPAKVRIAAAGEIMGYDSFYIYDFGLVHTVLTDFYAMVDGEIVQIGGSWGGDPADSTFVKDLDGDGTGELICNLTYSGDGGQAVRIYKRDGEQIWYAYDDCEYLVGLDEEYVSYANSYYDAESGKIIVCGVKDGEYQELLWELDMTLLQFWKYTPGY